MWFNSSGRVEFDRTTINRAPADREGWCSLSTSQGILGFYSHLITQRGVILEKPAFGSHVTLARREFSSLSPKSWGDVQRSLQGRRVNFKYHPYILTDGYWWFLQVESREIRDIQATLGMDTRRAAPLHLTLGRTVYSPLSSDYKGCVSDIVGRTAVVALCLESDPSVPAEVIQIRIPSSKFNLPVQVGNKVLIQVRGKNLSAFKEY